MTANGLYLLSLRLRHFFAIQTASLALVLVFGYPSPAAADALSRLQLDRLKKTHEAVQNLQRERQPVELRTEYRDYRACLHVHSGLSHDSNASISEVVAGAKAANVHIILFNEHPAAHYDYVKDGHRGIRDGVLLIPGAETNGFLAFPETSVQNLGTSSPQEFVDLVRRTGGMIFLSHLEARFFQWKFTQMTGAEIYNSHADVMDEIGLVRNLPFQAITMQTAIESYPQEVYSAIQDYPTFYLRMFDSLCRIRPHTGVAANDAHHNLVFVAKLGAAETLIISDFSGDTVFEIPRKQVAGIDAHLPGKQVGDEILRLDIDPYEISLRHVSTHLLMNELTKEATQDALTQGRAYVAFDWLADPTGFVYCAEDNGQTVPLGSEIPWSPTVKLRSEAPLAGLVRVICDGKPVHEAKTRSCEYSPPKPGIYRVEYWLDVAGESKPWILSNPVYLRP